MRNRIASIGAKNNGEVGGAAKKRSVASRLKSRASLSFLEAMKSALDPLFLKYNRVEFLGSDPIEFPHRFSDPWDQEAVALFSAVLAYGNVTQIRRSVEDLLGRIRSLDLSPAEMIRSLATSEGERAWRTAAQGFIHRFNVGEDFVLFALLLSRSWQRYGSFGAHLVSHTPPDAKDFGDGLSKVFRDWTEWRKDYAPAPESFTYLLTSPSQGSACKRWCMLTRWMVRKDAVDLGLWQKGSKLLPAESPGLNPRQLVMPLDTHTGRISQYLGLTERKSLGWKAAVEITERLRECAPDDPVKYDFALARLGILDVCQLRFRVEICMGCDLVQVCRFARKGLSSRASRSTSS